MKKIKEAVINADPCLMENRAAYQGIFPMVYLAFDGGVRILHLYRPLYDVYVLRGCLDSDVFAHRRLGQR